MSQQYPAFPGVPHDPDRRPGTVTAACATTLVFAGLTLLLLVLTLLGMLAARDQFADVIQRDPAFVETGIDVDDAFGVVVGIVGVLALWCVVACVLAVLALRRSGGGRIALAVSAGLSAVVSLVAALGAIVPGVVTLASIAVVVLLFAGGTNDWYARRGSGATGLPHGWTQQGQQFSQHYGASAAPYGQPPYGQPTHPSQPPQPPQPPGAGQSSEPGPGRPPYGQPTYPAYPEQQPGQRPDAGDRPGTGQDPGDDRPVQKPWG